MKRGMPPILAALLLSLPVSAPAAAPDGPALYRQHCARCHGDSGHADTWRGYLYFARNFSDPGWQAKRSDEFILRRISEGPGLMPAFADKLTAAERQALLPVVRGFSAQ